MKRYVLLLLVLFITGVSKSQDTLSKREQNLKQAINMNEQDFKTYARTMRNIQQRILAVHKDSTMPFEQKKSTLLALHSEKETYIKSHLSAEQQGRLNDFNKSNEHHSGAYYKRQQQMEKRKQNAQKQNGS